ncbi:MAG: valine--tRNA ligase [Oscillospiraceae bacterium]|nr:valine--tRNA ligase [Oscillospiraceae bacterium]
MKELAKTYSPKDFEERIYTSWEENGYFHQEPISTKTPYTIVIPPPNITGQLHMGHALNNTYQDILIRWRRMQGYNTLWLPGTDHASIATEARVVEMLKSKGISKQELTREQFLEHCREWRVQYGGLIVKQLKKLGSSCDWSRERFTLDEGCSRAVLKVFVELYEKGKIYHGTRIINWCPVCRTSISDVEVEYEEKDGNLWHIKYPLSDGDGWLEVATTRPETMLGDTALAVNPNDERYKHVVGKTVILPLVNKELPVIADEYVDTEFGTGVVKITPAHDPNDFEVGLRHNLPLVNVMDDQAVINGNGGKYVGLSRSEARREIVKDLEQQGLLVKTQAHTHNVGGCQRCTTTVEPKASLQWFVKMEELAKPAIDVVKSGKIKMLPKKFEHSYLSWMENIRDWCISRQLWWGHRIPAYYCQNADCAKETVSIEVLTKCPVCAGAIKQDEDTLDTWFSSALWPFSTLGWPEETSDYKQFYPTNTLVTASDIIFFWVARMVFSGLEYTGKIPFDTVLFNGIVRDEKGKKMSKSSGNGVDPLEIIDKYGADALRLTLVVGNAPGNDMRWTEDKINANRNFINKLWNASRYILMNIADEPLSNQETENLSTEDKWILSLYNNLIKDVTHNLENFELGVALGKVVDFIWDIYCDWYIELTKPRILSGGTSRRAALNTLVYVMRGMLKLLHPFAPFVSEEIMSALPKSETEPTIMLSQWEEYNPQHEYKKEREDFQKVIEIISGIRAKRAELNAPMSRKINLIIEAKQKDLEVFDSCKAFFERLAGAQSTVLTEQAQETDNMAVVITPNAKTFIPLGDLVDKEKEAQRLAAEKKAVKKDIDFLSAKLNNPGFLNKAPAAQIQREKEKLHRAQEKMEKILQLTAVDS